MASEIRVNNITSLSGVGTITPSATGVEIAGITTVATLRATTGIVTAFQGDIVIEDKIIHSGDTNTAIRFPAADTVSVETGGSERLRIKANGNVGIGSADPQENLDIRGAGASVIRLTTNNNLSYTNLRQNQTGKYFEITPSSTSNQSFIVNKPNGDEAVRIDSSGRVIIGAQITVDTGGYYDDITLNNSNTASGEAGGAGLSIVSGSSSYGGVIFSRSNSHGRGYVKYDQTNDRLILGTQTTDKIMIEDNTNNGDVHIKTGNIVMDAAGKGIDFSAAGNAGGMTSELLDDYEEGTWTPTYENGSGSITVNAYSIQQGTYTKIGNMVYVEGGLRANVTNNSNGTYDIGGLPFTSANTSNSSGILHGKEQNSWTVAPHHFSILQNTDQARARGGIDVGDAAYSTANSNGFNSGSVNNNRVFFHGVYRAA